MTELVDLVVGIIYYTRKVMRSTYLLMLTYIPLRARSSLSPKCQSNDWLDSLYNENKTSVSVEIRVYAILSTLRFCILLLQVRLTDHWAPTIATHDSNNDFEAPINITKF